jgi:hypothetical protein
MHLHDGNYAARQQSLRALAELAALDEAAWHKFLDEQAPDDGVSGHLALLLRHEVERFAAEQNIDLSRGSSGYWLLEFYDPDAEPGEGFRGAVVIWGMDANDAVDLAVLFEAHPGGEVRARQIPRQKVPDQGWRERVLSASELHELGDISSPYYDA